MSSRAMLKFAAGAALAAALVGCGEESKPVEQTDVPDWASEATSQGGKSDNVGSEGRALADQPTFTFYDSGYDNHYAWVYNDLAEDYGTWQVRVRREPARRLYDVLLQAYPDGPIQVDEGLSYVGTEHIGCVYGELADKASCRLDAKLLEQGYDAAAELGIEQEDVGYTVLDGESEFSATAELAGLLTKYGQATEDGFSDASGMLECHDWSYHSTSLDGPEAGGVRCTFLYEPAAADEVWIAAKPNDSDAHLILTGSLARELRSLWEQTDWPDAPVPTDSICPESGDGTVTCELFSDEMTFPNAFAGYAEQLLTFVDRRNPSSATRTFWRTVYATGQDDTDGGQTFRHGRFECSSAGSYDPAMPFKCKVLGPEAAPAR